MAPIKITTSIPISVPKRPRAPLALGSNSPSPPPSPRKRIKQSPAPIDLSKPRPASREPSLEPESRCLGLGYSNAAAKPLAETVPEEEEEDDYLTLALPEDTERKSRHPPENMKSKAELHAQAAKARDLALQKSLLDEEAVAGKSKGMKLLKAMGYVPGQGLGKEGKGNMEPVTVKVRGKEDKRGVGGVDKEEKEWYDDEKKLREVDVEGYRGRVANEKEMKRWEGMAWAGMGIFEQLSEKEGVKPVDQDGKEHIFLRLLHKDRRMTEMERLRAREGYSRTVVEEGDDDEESDIEDFKSKGAGEQLDIVVEELRTQFNYCFWCKYQYEDDSMEGCPGGGEDGHG